jgi:hypothetical protein
VIPEISTYDDLVITCATDNFPVRVVYIASKLAVAPGDTVRVAGSFSARQ